MRYVSNLVMKTDELINFDLTHQGYREISSQRVGISSEGGLRMR